MRGSSSALWKDKYKPKIVEELFHQKEANLVSEWIRLQSCYKCENHVAENSNSFIFDDSMEDMYSPMALEIINNHQWKLKALILKGNSSIGKTELVKVVSKTLNYECHECAANVNQKKYLK